MTIPRLKIQPKSRRGINWSLWIGIVLILLVSLLAVKGPDWAPRHPLEITNVLRVGEKWEVPPYSFSTPGFPLGSDQFGRDLLSQLLWAVRPTLILVLVVAGVRLLFGILIGLVAGWSDRWYGYLLNLAIAFGLAVPVLLVSLIVIARMGLRYGIWTFIVGLAVTGWAETAYYVRDQTRLFKGHIYIEAARALGSTTASILRHHIFRQLRPLLTMLAVFEISSTLMLVAELGFLGFFLGGGVFIPIDDFTTRAGIGMPELGQMLAVGLNLTTEPFGLVVAGTVIFITILGFNLIGAGLRRRLSLQHVRERTILDGIRETINLWLDENILYPLGNFNRGRWGHVLQAALLVLLIAVSTVIFLPRQEPQPDPNAAAEMPLILPSATRVPESTLIPGATPSPTTASARNAEILWQFPTEGMPVPPIITEDGLIYLVTHENILYILEADGSPRAQQSLSPPPYSFEVFNAPRTALSPQISADGRIIVIASDQVYALDESGRKLWEVPLEVEPNQEACCSWNPKKTIFYLLDQSERLYAFSAEEGLRWKFAPAEGDITYRSAPLAGSNGMVYYSASSIDTGYLFAVGNSGELSWKDEFSEEDDSGMPGFIDRYFGYSWLELSPDEKLLFFNQDIIDASTGEVLELGIAEQIPALTRQLGLQEHALDPVLRYFADQDGRIYLLTSYPIIAELANTERGTGFMRPFASQDFPIGLPADRAGVAQNRYLWMEFSSFTFFAGPADEEGVAILWMDMESSAERSLFIRTGKEMIAAMDESTGSYVLCRSQRDPAQVQCRTESPLGDEAGWQTTVDGIASLKYASLDLRQERLYIFGRDNVLYAVDVSSP